MKFKTTTISGYGRGKELGFPTINMIIPELIPIQLRQGIYAAYVKINDEMYKGALYYGSVPTFAQSELTLEVYLLDVVRIYVAPDSSIEVDTVKYIRPIKEFKSPELLVLQMEKDVEEIKKILDK